MEPEPEPEPEPEQEPEPEPKPEEQASLTVEQVPTAVSATAPSESDVLAPVSGVPGAIAGSNNFRFMQDSELEGPFDEALASVPVAAQDPTHGAAVNGHTEEVAAPAPEVRCFDTHIPSISTHVVGQAAAAVDWAADDKVVTAIDWAADETTEGLPPIAGLHAEFGASGSATPAEQVNGQVPIPGPGAPSQDNEGFTQAARGHRGDGRGRGRGGYRGDRGGFRGGFRGHGDRGHYRGRGGDRGRGGGGMFYFSYSR